METTDTRRNDEHTRTVPLPDRLAWTLADAAKVYSMDVQALRKAAIDGKLTVYRGLNRSGTQTNTVYVDRAAMEEFIHYLKNETNI